MVSRRRGTSTSLRFVSHPPSLPSLDASLTRPSLASRFQLRDIELIAQEKLGDPSAGESEKGTLTKIQDILYSTEVCLSLLDPSLSRRSLTILRCFFLRSVSQEGFEVPEADLVAEGGAPGQEDETF